MRIINSVESNDGFLTLSFRCVVKPLLSEGKQPWHWFQIFYPKQSPVSVKHDPGRLSIQFDSVRYNSIQFDSIRLTRIRKLKSCNSRPRSVQRMDWQQHWKQDSQWLLSSPTPGMFLKWMSWSEEWDCREREREELKDLRNQSSVSDPQLYPRDKLFQRHLVLSACPMLLWRCFPFCCWWRQKHHYEPISLQSPVQSCRREAVSTPWLASTTTHPSVEAVTTATLPASDPGSCDEDILTQALWLCLNDWISDRSWNIFCQCFPQSCLSLNHMWLETEYLLSEWL